VQPPGPRLSTCVGSLKAGMLLTVRTPGCPLACAWMADLHDSQCDPLPGRRAYLAASCAACHSLGTLLPRPMQASAQSLLLKHLCTTWLVWSVTDTCMLLAGGCALHQDLYGQACACILRQLLTVMVGRTSVVSSALQLVNLCAVFSIARDPVFPEV
jgi:hypothetical protein